MRLSPSKSATLYTVGTKKKGNDGNIWIIVINKNNVKRWQLHTKTMYPIETRIKPTDLYSDVKPILKKNNWNRMMKYLNNKEIKFINKLRASYKTITRETGIRIIEVILPYNYGIYNMSHAWDYAEEVAPEMRTNTTNAYMIIVYKLDEDGYILAKLTSAQHQNIKYDYKKKLLEYIKQFNKENIDKIKWNGNIKHTIDFIIN